MNDKLKGMETMEINGICPSCGNNQPMPEGKGMAFCSMCGTLIETASSAAPAAAPVTAPAAPLDFSVPEEETPQAKSSFPKPLIAVAAAVLITVCALIPSLAGNSSYQKAEANFLGSVLSGINSSGGKGTEITFSADYSPSDFMEDSGVTGLTVSGNLQFDGEKAAATMSMSDDRGDGLDFVFAFGGTEMTLSIPEITDYYLRWLAGDADEQLDLNKLDRKKLSSTVKNISKIYFDAVKNETEVEKGVELSGGNTTVKCDKHTIVFTEEMVGKILGDAVKELRKNKNLLDFFSEISPGFYIEDILDDIEDAVARMDSRSSRLFRMTVWVSGKDIVARTIDRIQGSGMVLSYQYLVKSKNMYFEAKAIDRDRGVDYLVLTGRLEKESGAWNGRIDLSVNDRDYWSGSSREVLSLTARLDSVKIDGKFMTGTVRLTGKMDNDSANFDFRAVFSKEKSSQKIRLTGKIGDRYDEYDIGELNVTASEKSIKNVTLKKLDEDLAVDVGDYSSFNRRNAERMADDLYNFYRNEDGILSELVRSIYYMVY
jgi:hypothetical protein